MLVNGRANPSPQLALNDKSRPESLDEGLVISARCSANLTFFFNIFLGGS